jgi:hypothetical protein
VRHAMRWISVPLECDPTLIQHACMHTRLASFISPLLSSSYGSVYKALDKRDGKLVAIKVLEVENEDTIELQKEINILKECDCEWIVRYKGAYRKDGNIWIVRQQTSTGRTAADGHLA